MNAASLTRLASTALLFLGGACGTAAPEPPAMPHRHHTVDYLELAAPDLTVEKAFYSAAFGWTFNEYGPDYAGIKNDRGVEFAGIRKEPEVKRGGPLLVVYSDDLEASLESVAAAGGKIVVEPFSFPGGRRFHFLDPANNELAVWTEE